jgi:carboxyl-terminal processing protease
MSENSRQDTDAGPRLPGDERRAGLQFRADSYLEALQADMKLTLAGFVRLASNAALSLLLIAHPGTADSWLSAGPASAKELTENQFLVAEAWKNTDRMFVDRSFAGQDWFALRKKMVKKNYEDREAAYDEIRAMLGSLEDKYTRFLTPNMYNAVYATATGDVAGIGCEIASSTGEITAIQKVAPDAKNVFKSIVEGSPADQADLKPGDVLEDADGFSLRGLSPEEAAAKVRGPKGSKLRLTVSREGEAEPLVKIITRAGVKLAGVTSSVQTANGEKVGFVRIKQFSTTTAADVSAALTELKGDGVKELVVDLRGNTGGYFPGGVDVARLFLKNESPITFVVDKRAQTTPFSTFEDGAYADVPLVLLVDGKTASASEILSSALQDNKRATLVGEQTFGKAVIQNVEKLSDGSAVVVTIAKYETPNRTDINKKGIEPQVKKQCPSADDAAVSCISEDLKLLLAEK